MPSPFVHRSCLVMFVHGVHKGGQKKVYISRASDGVDGITFSLKDLGHALLLWEGKCLYCWHGASMRRFRLVDCCTQARIVQRPMSNIKRRRKESM